METPLYTAATVIFILIAIILFVLILAGTNAALKRLADPSRKRKTIITGLVLLAWWSLLSMLAFKGFFMNFDAVPPRFALALVPSLAAVIILSRSRKIGRLLEAVPPSWLVYTQSFRIPLEIVLWLLFAGGVIPVQMTFEGFNWDIATGIAALFIGFFCFTSKRWPLKAALVWNFIGIALVINIVTIAILSAPVPFRTFMNEPSNTVVAHFPYVLLPGLMVPFALLLHFLSIRQLLTKNK